MTLQAYSRLRRVLEDRNLTVPELHRRLQGQYQRINLKSLYRLRQDRLPLRRLDLRLAGALCQLLDVPLSDLITFEAPARKLRRLGAAKQKRLDALMARNNEGSVNRAERQELEALVREAEEIMLANARQLADHRQRLGAS
jgi:hypothetical protein